MENEICYVKTKDILSDARKIIENARNNAVRSVDFCRVRMYWNLGKRIFEEEQEGKDRADYGAYLIKNLALSLEKEFGSGFSERQLKFSRQFYRTYPIGNALRSQLNWTQYRLLIQISDPAKREYYELELVHKQGYASYKRKELFSILKPFLGVIVNIQTGIEANLSKHSIDKMTSAKALEKSKANGFTLAEHFELAAKIKPLYESAILVVSHGNLKNPSDKNVVSIKRFVSAGILQSGKKADVLITVKESISNGHRIYSIELDEINKASERFEGLSDAAEKSADRATKTPHVDK